MQSIAWRLWLRRIYAIVCCFLPFFFTFGCLHFDHFECKICCIYHNFNSANKHWNEHSERNCISNNNFFGLLYLRFGRSVGRLLRLPRHFSCERERCAWARLHILTMQYTMYDNARNIEPSVASIYSILSISFVWLAYNGANCTLNRAAILMCAAIACTNPLKSPCISLDFDDFHDAAHS